MNDLTHWQQRFEDYWRTHQAPDNAHDIHHCRRVWRTASELIEGTERPVDALVVMAACYFHDIVSLPKNHPDRHRSSSLAAQQTQDILTDMQFPDASVAGVYHAVEAHSYSANIPCQSIEAEIVQDADRMEGLGAIGLARVFYTAGKLDSHLFDSDDPWARQRDLDDRRFAIDHFPLKLLTIADTMNTEAGKAMATRATDYLRDYLTRLDEELNGHYR